MWLFSPQLLSPVIYESSRAGRYDWLTLITWWAGLIIHFRRRSQSLSGVKSPICHWSRASTDQSQPALQNTQKKRWSEIVTIPVPGRAIKDIKSVTNLARIEQQDGLIECLRWNYSLCDGSVEVPPIGHQPLLASRQLGARHKGSVT